MVHWLRVVSTEGIVTRIFYQVAFVVPLSAWVIYPVDAKWIMHGDTDTFTFKCALDHVRLLKDSDISLMLNFAGCPWELDEYDIDHAIPVLTEVTSPYYGRELTIDRDRLEFVQYALEGEMSAPQTVQFFTA